MRRKALLACLASLAIVLLTLASGSLNKAGTAAAQNAPPPPPELPQATIPVPSSSCASLRACARAMLKMVDGVRTEHELQLLDLTMAQTKGNGSCAGSLGHSTAMARSGSIWHSNATYPKASFPRNICVPYRLAGENVGESQTGDVSQDLVTLNTLMMTEPHRPRDCAKVVNHACNILNPSFRHVGIAVYRRGGITWLTEDFTS